MQEFISQLRCALLASLVLALVCCGLYPLLVYTVAQVLFPSKANGSLILDQNGAVRGSGLLGQRFVGKQYFHPRPSAAGQGYDAANSGGSNLGPTSRKLHDSIRERLTEYRKQNRLPKDQPIPADAVTASGSGLDPHISLANAQLQAARVARVRGLSGASVDRLIRSHTEGPGLGILGDAGVNVLTLNLALDLLEGSRP